MPLFLLKMPVTAVEIMLKSIIQQGRGTSKSVVALRILYLGVLNYTEIFIECLNKTCKYTLCIYIYNNKEKKI